MSQKGTFKNFCKKTPIRKITFEVVIETFILG